MPMKTHALTLMVLSASAVTRRLPVASKAAAKMPLSLSRLPGCTALAPAWKLLLLFQSQNLRVVPGVLHWVHDVAPHTTLTGRIWQISEGEWRCGPGSRDSNCC